MGGIFLPSMREDCAPLQAHHFKRRVFDCYSAESLSLHVGFRFALCKKYGGDYSFAMVLSQSALRDSMPLRRTGGKSGGILPKTIINIDYLNCCNQSVSARKNELINKERLRRLSEDWYLPIAGEKAAISTDSKHSTSTRRKESWKPAARSCSEVNESITYQMELWSQAETYKSKAGHYKLI